MVDRLRFVWFRGVLSRFCWIELIWLLMWVLSTIWSDLSKPLNRLTCAGTFLPTAGSKRRWRFVSDCVFISMTKKMNTLVSTHQNLTVTVGWVTVCNTLLFLFWMSTLLVVLQCMIYLMKRLFMTLLTHVNCSKEIYHDGYSLLNLCCFCYVNCDKCIIDSIFPTCY